MLLRAAPHGALVGAATLPGDKSISHRALMLAGMAVGESRIEGLLEGEDVLATARALGAMGVELERTGAGRWRVWGVGVGGLAEPADILDMGNAGTGARLLMGLLAGHGFAVHRDENIRSIATSLLPELGKTTRRIKHLRVVTADRLPAATQQRNADHFH